MKEKAPRDKRQKIEREREDRFGGKGEQRCGKWGGKSREEKGREGSINCIYKHISIVTDW